MARSQKIVAGVLLTFVVFTAGFAVGKEVGVRRVMDRMPAPAPSVARDDESSEGPERRLVARYYHATKRCKKCNTIEAYAREALDTLFADRLASGEIAWEVANMDDVWNQDAVRRYGLLRSSLVFVEMCDGLEQDFSVLHRVWELTDDKKTFFAFIESEVEMVLDGWEDPGADSGADSDAEE